MGRSKKATLELIPSLAITEDFVVADRATCPLFKVGASRAGGMKGSNTVLTSNDSGATVTGYESIQWSPVLLLNVPVWRQVTS